jgi:hypothetical protein
LAEIEAATRPANPTMRRHRDWYVVLYQLAAQRTNGALRLPDSPERKAQLRRARDETRLRLKMAAGTVNSRLRYGWRLRDRGLFGFLENEVIPTGCVLLAGVMAELGEAGQDGGATVDSLARGTAASPEALVAYVTARRRRSVQTNYNLACFYASPRPGEEAMRDRNAAADHLMAVVDAVFDRQLAYYQTKARNDPSLRLLRAAVVGGGTTDPRLAFMAE